MQNFKVIENFLIEEHFKKLCESKREDIDSNSIKVYHNKIDKFKYIVSITKDKYIEMLKKKYISCLVNLSKDQIIKGVKEVKNIYPNKILFEDVLICIKYKH